LGHQSHAAVCCERSVTPPFGLEGGAPGAPARIEMTPPHGNPQKPNSKGGFLVPPGGRVVIEAPGSGGFGDPAARDRARLSEDLADGYVTPAAARRDYRFNPG
jgi:N-methylhydantoinase B